MTLSTTLTLRDATQWHMMMAGEALRAIRRLDPGLANSLPALPDMTNALRQPALQSSPHHLTQVWTAVQNDVPRLRLQAASMLEALDDVSSTPRSPAQPATPDPLAGKHEQVAALCREYGVLRLDLFGSAAKGAFDPATSDLDFVLAFEDRGLSGYARRYLRFAEALEILFGRPVDVIFDDAIRNPYFREEIEETRRRIDVAPDAPAAA